MKLASFNVENLFDRAVAMNQPTLEAGKAALEAAAQLNAILRRRSTPPLIRGRSSRGSVISVS
jgi:hypothetical protein